MADDHGTVDMSSTLVIDWTVNEVNEALAAAKAGEKRTFKMGTRHPLDAWQLYLTVHGSEEYANRVGVFLYARATADRARVAGMRDWVRDGVYEIKFEVLSADGQVSLHPALMMQDKRFDHPSGCWGFPKGFPRSVLEQSTVTTPNAFKLRCTIKGTAPACETLPTPPPSCAFFYDDPACSDVVFMLEDGEGTTVGYLFALKKLLVQQCAHFRDLFESGFSEAIERVDLDLSTLQRAPPSVYEGDSDDFHAFRDLTFTFDSERAMEVDGDPDESTLAAVDTEPSSSPPPDEPSSPTEAALRASPSPSGAPAEENSLSQALPVVSSTRTFTQIKVKDCSFATFDAFLFYLYTGELKFFRAPSSALAEATGAAIPRTDLLVTSSKMWLKQREMGEQRCTAHHLYRLADRFLMTEMKERIKRHIVRRLTVANVAYEAFSQLSLDFDDIQQPVLEFLLDHWDQVQSTKSMEQVFTLIGEGALPGGAGILQKITKGMVKAPKKVDGEKKAHE